MDTADPEAGFDADTRLPFEPVRADFDKLPENVQVVAKPPDSCGCCFVEGFVAIGTTHDGPQGCAWFGKQFTDHTLPKRHTAASVPIATGQTNARRTEVERAPYRVDPAFV
jgi:hypothetical protein